MLKIYITRKKGSSYHFLPECAQWSDKNAELWLKKGDLGVPVPHRRGPGAASTAQLRPRGAGWASERLHLLLICSGIRPGRSWWRTSGQLWEVSSASRLLTNYTIDSTDRQASLCTYTKLTIWFLACPLLTSYQCVFCLPLYVADTLGWQALHFGTGTIRLHRCSA